MQDRGLRILWVDSDIIENNLQLFGNDLYAGAWFRFDVNDIIGKSAGFTRYILSPVFICHTQFCGI